MRASLSRVFANQMNLNMISGFISSVASVALSLISYPIYLTYLGFENLGIWVALTTFINVAQVLNVGIGPILSRTISESHAKGDIKGIHSSISNAFTVTILLALALSSILFLFDDIFFSIIGISGNNAVVAKKMTPYVCVLTIYIFCMQVYTSALSGLGRLDKANYRDTTCKISTLCVSFVCLYSGLGILSLAIGFISGNIINQLLSGRILRSILGAGYISLKAISLQRCRMLILASSYILYSSILSLSLIPLIKMIVSRSSGLVYLSAFEIAYSSSVQIRTIVESAFRALIPEIAKISQFQRPNDRIKAQYKKALVIVIITIPFFITLWLFSDLLFRLWLQSRFIDKIPMIFNIFIVCTVISLFGVPAYYVLLGVGKTKTVFMSHAVMTSVNLLILTLLFVLEISLSPDILAWSLVASTTMSTTLLLLSVASLLRRMPALPPFRTS